MPKSQKKSLYPIKYYFIILINSIQTSGYQFYNIMQNNHLAPEIQNDVETAPTRISQPVEAEFTLTEPVCTTIMRDVKQIISKIKQVMIPSFRSQGKRDMRNWDLWGPFILCLLLSLTLSIRTNEGAEIIFTTIFIIMWAGSMIISINAKFLGAEMSIFQSACLLGYCVFPINLAAIATAVFSSFMPALVKLILVGVSFMWASISSMSFLVELVPQRKRKLALYPVILFYLFLSWFALVI